MDRSEFRDPQLRKVVDYLWSLRDDLREELVRVEVVATVDALPPSAPPQRMFRVAADPTSVYYGQGQGRKLLKVTGEPMP